MRDPVVDGPEPGRDEMRIRRSRPQRAGEREGDRRLERPADPGPHGHAKARHRNTAPASATTAPAARSATLPIGHRCTTPIAMPSAVESAGGDDEPEAVHQAALAGRELRPVGVAVEDGEGAHEHRRGHERRLPFEGHHEPQQEHRERDADLDAGHVARRPGPRNPPTAITIGKVTGSSQTAGGPSCAPQRPTETIASTWSRPEIGCSSPVRKPWAWPSWTCARTGVALARSIRPAASAARSGPRGLAVPARPLIAAHRAGSTSAGSSSRRPSDPTA